MQTVEMYFNDTIDKYRHYKEAALLLTQEVPSLSSVEIQIRCAYLTILQRELTDSNDQLCLIMEDLGPEVLETPYIGELQRAIDKSVLACDSLHAEIVVYRNCLPEITA